MNKVLIVGSGGREHALARAFAKSGQVSQVYVAPGNPGMVTDKIDTVAIEMMDIDRLVDFAQAEEIDLTFVGAEQPLEAGLVDRMRDQGLDVVGPTQEAAQLESSKTYAKEVMAQAGVPTGGYRYFQAQDSQGALAYAREVGLPCVIKVDGLMAGKGVVIAESDQEVEATLQDFMEDQGLDVLIEEFLEGPEFSHFSLVNGDHIIPIGVACDYKRIGEEDQGLNTGGMGAFSPVPWVGEDLEAQVLDQVVRPVAQQMVANGTPFTGVLYSGLMLTAQGPKVIEFNTRFGDPETQVVLARLESDFYDVIQAHLNQEQPDLLMSDQTQLGVILASQGYPETYPKGMDMTLDSAIPEDQVYYAGVSLGEEGQLLASGGRILMITAGGEDLQAARQAAYQLMDLVEIDQTYYRRDIGLHREGR